MRWIPAAAVVAMLCGGIASTGWAQSAGGANNASTPRPSQPAPAADAGPVPLPPAASPQRCDLPIDNALLGAPSAVMVSLDPDTLWRPRGTEVHFTLSSTTGTMPAVRRVFACFRWQMAHSGEPQQPYARSPLVRSIPNTSGAIGYGAVVPALPPASRDGTGANHFGAVSTTAIGTVPVAEMQVVVELADDKNSWFAVVLPVGITAVPTGLLFLAIGLIVSLGVLWYWAPKPLLAVWPQPPDATPENPKLVSKWNLSRHALAVISTSNGIASLSQFQIILWSFVVGGAAVYVMALSGNLIAISTGTLTLLGIAGGTSVLARVPPMSKDDDDDAKKKAQALALVTTRTIRPPPHWSQMLVDDAANPEIDVTRVQMLIFTLISAAFVAITVATSYSIPEIPQNFLLLMGISNGVYLAGRQIQSTPKGTTP